MVSQVVVIEEHLITWQDNAAGIFLFGVEIFLD